MQMSQYAKQISISFNKTCKKLKKNILKLTKT